MIAKKSDIIQPPKREAAAQIWLIFGDDDFLVSRHAQAVIDLFCPRSERALGVDIVDGRVEDVDSAVRALRQSRACLENLGLFSSAKVVWLRDATMLHEGEPGRFSAVKEELARLTADLKRGLLPGQRFIVTAAKVDKRSSFFKTCQTLGEVREFAVPIYEDKRDSYARQILGMLLNELGLNADAAAIEGIIGKVGCNSRLLAQEVEKLRDYIGSRTRILEEDVRQVVAPARERASWDLADALGDRDPDKTLTILRQLLFQGEEVFLLIMGLQHRVREWLVCRTCHDNGWLRINGSGQWTSAEWCGAGAADSVLADLPEKLHPAHLKPYYAGRRAAQALKFSRDELLRAQRILLDTHEAMIRTSAPADLLLELGLIKILGKAHAA
jgi:DNA polymerase III delta subunit